METFGDIIAAILIAIVCIALGIVLGADVNKGVQAERFKKVLPIYVKQLKLSNNTQELKEIDEWARSLGLRFDINGELIEEKK